MTLIKETDFATPQEADPASDTTLQQASDRAAQIYEEKLRPTLEAERLGEMVAIHPDTGDYAVGRNSPAARRELRRRQPVGPILTMSIGPERPSPAIERAIGSSDRC